MDFKTAAIYSGLIGAAFLCWSSIINIAYRRGYRDAVSDVYTIGKAFREENK